MCQIWIKESGIVLPRTFWDSINSANREGLGLYNISKDEIVKTQDYDEGWRYINENKDDKMVVHHRLATSGAKTCEQLHGWDMDNGYVFFHNGVLKTYRGTATMSDTQQFVEEWMGAPVKGMIKYLEAMEKSSRFVFVHKETGEILRPDCARWNPVYIHELGQTVQFSNDYAFNYPMLPPAYSRWGGHDDDWAYGGGNTRYFNSSANTKKQRTTRSGAKTTKRVVSVFEKSLSVLEKESIELKGINAFDSKKNVHVNADMGVEFMSEPKKVVGSSTLYVMPDIMRITGEQKYIMGTDLLAHHKDEKHEITVFDNDFCDVITMNDVVDSGSADITKAFIRIARTSKLITQGAKVVKNTALYKYIRSYELRIGSRVNNQLTLAQFLHLACEAELAYEAKKLADTDEMQASSCLVEALAEELTTNQEFKYFKSFAKRVLTRYETDLQAEILEDLKAAEKAAQERRSLGKRETGVISTSLTRGKVTSTTTTTNDTTLLDDYWTQRRMGKHYY